VPGGIPCRMGLPRPALPCLPTCSSRVSFESRKGTCFRFGSPSACQRNSAAHGMQCIARTRGSKRVRAVGRAPAHSDAVRQRRQRLVDRLHLDAGAPAPRSSRASERTRRNGGTKPPTRATDGPRAVPGDTACMRTKQRRAAGGSHPSRCQASQPADRRGYSRRNHSRRNHESANRRRRRPRRTPTARDCVRLLSPAPRGRPRCAPLAASARSPRGPHARASRWCGAGAACCRAQPHADLHTVRLRISDGRAGCDGAPLGFSGRATGRRVQVGVRQG